MYENLSKIERLKELRNLTKILAMSLLIPFFSCSTTTPSSSKVETNSSNSLNGIWKVTDTSEIAGKVEQYCSIIQPLPSKVTLGFIKIENSSDAEAGKITEDVLTNPRVLTGSITENKIDLFVSYENMQSNMILNKTNNDTIEGTGTLSVGAIKSNSTYKLNRVRKNFTIYNNLGEKVKEIN